ncbi:MAG: hypothetical protein V4539_10845 [Bacteroidota bacterium]
MEKLTREQVIQIVKKQFEDAQVVIAEDSSMDTVQDWDSLVHLGILVALDVELDGRAASIKKLAGSRSVKEIIDALNENQLIAG